MILDTFDGRLHRNGVRCELRTAGAASGLELRLTDGRGEVTSSAVDHRIRWADELPPGPLRSRLAALADTRALLPVVEFSARMTSGTARNRDGKAVATLTIWSRIRPASTGHALPDLLEVSARAGPSKSARAIAALARDEGFQPFDGDVVEFVAISRNVDLAGFDGSPAVSLHATMAATVGVRLVLARLLAIMDATRDGTLERIDTEFLHDYRIAVRRTRTILREFKRILPDNLIDEARALFAELGRITGPPRDLDVTLIEWPDYLDALAPEDTRHSSRCGS